MSKLTATIQSLSIVPVAAAVVAFVFDLGTFTVFGTAHYALFGLSEHLLFAIEASPNAFTLIIVICAAISLVLRQGSDERGWFTIFPFLLAATPIIVFLYSELNVRNFGPAGILGIIAIILVAIVVEYNVNRKFRHVLLGIFLSLVIITSVFFQGITTARNWLKYPPAYSIKLKNGTVVAAMLLKSGDRGVLIYVHERLEFQFYRWEAIEGLSRNASDMLGINVPAKKSQ